MVCSGNTFVLQMSMKLLLAETQTNFSHKKSTGRFGHCERGKSSQWCAGPPKTHGIHWNSPKSTHLIQNNLRGFPTRNAQTWWWWSTCGFLHQVAGKIPGAADSSCFTCSFWWRVGIWWTLHFSKWRQCPGCQRWRASETFAIQVPEEELVIPANLERFGLSEVVNRLIGHEQLGN